jgi:hypothetical protein
MSSTLVALRAAHHPETTPKYDRVVFEFSGGIPQLRIEYANELIADGSGLPVPIGGRYILLVQFTPARAHSDSGQATAAARMKPMLPIIRRSRAPGTLKAWSPMALGWGGKPTRACSRWTALGAW